MPGSRPGESTRPGRRRRGLRVARSIPSPVTRLTGWRRRRVGGLAARNRLVAPGSPCKSHRGSVKSAHAGVEQPGVLATLSRWRSRVQVPSLAQPLVHDPGLCTGRVIRRGLGHPVRTYCGGTGTRREVRRREVSGFDSPSGLGAGSVAEPLRRGHLPMIDRGGKPERVRPGGTPPHLGPLAQLGERSVHTGEVVGSSPAGTTSRLRAHMPVRRRWRAAADCKSVLSGGWVRIPQPAHQSLHRGVHRPNPRTRQPGAVRAPRT